jgi:hypothetical protein
MKIVFSEMETEILKELRKWAESKYKTHFEMLNYEEVLAEFWKEKLK